MGSDGEFERFERSKIIKLWERLQKLLKMV